MNHTRIPLYVAAGTALALGVEAYTPESKPSECAVDTSSACAPIPEQHPGLPHIDGEATVPTTDAPPFMPNNSSMDMQVQAAHRWYSAQLRQSLIAQRNLALFAAAGDELPSNATA